MCSNTTVSLAAILTLLLTGGTASAFEARQDLNQWSLISSMSRGGDKDNKGEDKGDQDQDQDQDHGQDNGQDNGQDQDDGEDKPKQEERQKLRVDCRYHNEENIAGIGHCYASAIYVPEENGYSHVRLGVGCDYKTIYNDQGRVHVEQVSERISPRTSAFPGVEIFPQGALREEGTYESILDIRAGRLSGTCYVHNPNVHNINSVFPIDFFDALER